MDVKCRMSAHDGLGQAEDAEPVGVGQRRIVVLGLDGQLQADGAGHLENRQIQLAVDRDHPGSVDLIEIALKNA